MIAIILSGGYYLFLAVQCAAGLSVELMNLASGIAIGIADAEESAFVYFFWISFFSSVNLYLPRLFMKKCMIELFGSALGIYGNFVDIHQVTNIQFPDQ